MHQCDNCQLTFEEPHQVESTEWEEFWGAPVPRATVEDQCPYCGSPDITAIDTEEDDEHEQATA